MQKRNACFDWMSLAKLRLHRDFIEALQSLNNNYPVLFSLHNIKQKYMHTIFILRFIIIHHVLDLTIFVILKI